MSEEQSLVTFYDEYGFEYKWTQDVCDMYTAQMAELEKTQMEEWDKYLAKIGGIEELDVSSKAFKALMRKGLPMCLRPIVWMKFLKINEKMKNDGEIYRETLGLTEVIKGSFLDTIRKDVPRTFTSHKTLQREELTHVLSAFTATHPDIGYCQSINFIAAILIVVLGEEPAFFVLSTIIEDYLPDDYYSDGMHGFRIDLKLFDTLLQERTPEVYNKAKSLHHEWMMTASGWLLTLFSNTFPVSTVLRIWDSFFVEGPKIIYRVALGFIRLHQNKLLSAARISDFTKLIGKLENEMIDQNALMRESFGLSSFSRAHLIDQREIAKRFVDTGIDETKKPSRAREIFGKHK